MNTVDRLPCSNKPPPNRGPFASEDEALREVVKRLVSTECFGRWRSEATARENVDRNEPDTRRIRI